MTVTNRPIYLDSHATTPVAPGVLEAMVPFFSEIFGNTSAASLNGDRAAEAVEGARGKIAGFLGSSQRDVVFTSGATESVNIALQGYVRARAGETPIRVALTPVEHKAVLRTIDALTHQGLVEPIFLRVDADGQLDLSEVEKLAREGVSLLCVMKANNEIGNIYPVEQVARIAHDHGAHIFTDATQAVGWIRPAEPLYGADLLALSGHKVYGPKGIGALVLSPAHRLAPILFGGRQERGLRPGTHNVPGIVGLGAAIELRAEKLEEDVARISRLRDDLYEGLCTGLGDVVLNGEPRERLPQNLNVSILGVQNDALLANLRHEVTFSLGSACTAAEEGPSHVLRAIGADPDRLETAVRFGLTCHTERAEIDAAISAITESAERLRKVCNSRAEASLSAHSR